MLGTAVQAALQVHTDVSAVSSHYPFLPPLCTQQESSHVAFVLGPRPPFSTRLLFSIPAPFLIALCSDPFLPCLSLSHCRLCQGAPFSPLPGPGASAPFLPLQCAELARQWPPAPLLSAVTTPSEACSGNGMAVLQDIEGPQATVQ